MRVLILLLTLICLLSFAGPVTEPKSIGEWSEPVDGLRGRLLFAENVKDENGVRIGNIYLELQNLSSGDNRYVYYDAKKSPIHCELNDSKSDGVKVWPGNMSDGMPSACWLALPYDSSLRFDTRLGPAFTPSHPCLFICIGLEGGTWEIPLTATNDFYLSGTFTTTPPQNETRPHMWEGTLKLPPVKISVKNSQ